MKPRLHSARLTPEDLAIWMRIEACWDGDTRSKPWAWGLLSDRRDAHLMFVLETMREHWVVRYNRPKDYPAWPMVMIIARSEHAATGEFDITNFA